MPMSWPLVEPVAPAVLPVAALPVAADPVPAEPAPADPVVADPVPAAPVAEDPVVEPVPDILLSSVPRTSTWLFAYFCRSDWLPSSLMRVIAADELGEPEPDAALPVAPVPLPPVVAEPVPILAFIRTKALPALAAPAPVALVALELDPVVPLPDAPAASALCRQPVNVTCRLDCESLLPVCGGVVCALTPTAITADNTEPSTDFVHFRLLC